MAESSEAQHALFHQRRTACEDPPCAAGPRPGHLSQRLQCRLASVCRRRTIAPRRDRQSCRVGGSEATIPEGWRRLDCLRVVRQVADPLITSCPWWLVPSERDSGLFFRSAVSVRTVCTENRSPSLQHVWTQLAQRYIGTTAQARRLVGVDYILFECGALLADRRRAPRSDVPGSCDCGY